MLINDVPIECINHAAVQYHVPAALILSVLKTEGGRNGMAKKNKNGSIDYGVMQVNSLWVKKLNHPDYTAKDLQFNACKNVTVGTWILSRNIADGKGVKEGIGNYHSKTRDLNYRYHSKIISAYYSINNAIK